MSYHESPEVKEIVEAFAEILKFQISQKNGENYILPFHPLRDKLIFKFINISKNGSEFYKSLFGIYIRRQYYYTRETWAAISQIDEQDNDNNQRLKISNNLKNFIGKWDQNPTQIGLPSRSKNDEETLIIKRNFGALAETTIDPIAHAILSQYAICKRENNRKCLEILPEYIYRIVSGDVIVSDPCNKFWAMRLWICDNHLFNEKYKNISSKFEDELMACIGYLDAQGGFFISPKPPSWDSTPEIYTNQRSTMFSLINLLYIRRCLITQTPQSTNIDALVIKLDYSINRASQYIANEKINIFKNPYLAALFIKYNLAKLESAGDNLDTIKTEVINRFIEKEGEFAKTGTRAKRIKNLVWGGLYRKLITAAVSFIIAIVAIDDLLEKTTGQSLIHKFINFTMGRH